MSQLAQPQKAIAETGAKRGFVTDPHKIHLTLTEEIGENADAFALLSALATRFNIDLETAVTKKFFQKDSLRSWKPTLRTGQ